MRVRKRSMLTVSISRKSLLNVKEASTAANRQKTQENTTEDPYSQIHITIYIIIFMRVLVFQTTTL